MTRPLSGIRVVDLTTTVSGPHCTRLLADMGAEVIKIEPPGGETMRTRHPMRGGRSASYAHFNAGKKNVVLDLKNVAGARALRRLIGTADVLVENFRPGVMERLGLKADRLCSEVPHLVYCAISGYGLTGPSSHLPAYAPVIHATSGYDISHLAVQEGHDRPDNCGIVIADILAGAYGFGAICAALRRREVTGVGAIIDVSMMESMMQLLSTGVMSTQFPMPPAPQKWLYGPLRVKNGFITLAVASENTFASLARAIGHPEWLDDERFSSFLGVQAAWGDLHPVIESWTETRTRAEAIDLLSENGVPCAAYRTIAEVIEDPQVAHRKTLTEITDHSGTLRILGAPFLFGDVATTPGTHVSDLGEDGSAVLRQIGMTENQIANVTAKTSRN